jgi:metal-responsive CopG/Arc/MetJ family transcriptional regulator
MENVAIHVPRELAARIDEAAAAEYRTRNNLAKVLIVEGLQRREPAEPVKEESR